MQIARAVLKARQYHMLIATYRLASGKAGEAIHRSMHQVMTESPVRRHVPVASGG